VISTALIFAAALAGAAPVAVAQDTTLAPPAAQTAPDAIYRRERFVYPTSNRRNPFKSLLDSEESGPEFDNLDLVGVIFGGSAGSVATLIDRATEKRHRVRRGDVVGNARVVEIRPDAVVFQVNRFGMTTSETLRIRKEEEEQG
jgi:hypothetical protein